MRRFDVYDRGRIVEGELDVGRIFVDTKKVYLEAKAKAAELGQPKMRVDAMFVMVELLGSLTREVVGLRAEITRGEIGLHGFDSDLAGLQQRYRNLYRPFFADGMKPVETWTDEDWTSFEEYLEGPILTWNIKTCRERWDIPFGAPPCEGPDLLMVLSLMHQTGAAAELQQELIASHYGIADLTWRDIADTYEGLARSAGKAIAGAIGAIATGITDYVVPPSAKKGFGWGLGIAGALGLGGYLLWKKNKNNKGK